MKLLPILPLSKMIMTQMAGYCGSEGPGSTIMNKLSKTIYIALLIASTASRTLLANNNNNNNNSSYRFNKMAESLCDSAKTDQLNILRKSVRNARTHMKTLYPNVQCEGQTLLAVAEQNHSESVISYIKLKAKPEHAVSN
jgi:hypothetical protein